MEVRVLSSALPRHRSRDLAPSFHARVFRCKMTRLKRPKAPMSLFDVPLSTADSIYHLAVVVLVGGIALVLISTVSIIWSGVVRERYAAQRLAQNEAAIAQANLALKKAREQAADADNLLAQAKVEAAALEKQQQAAAAAFATSAASSGGREITLEKRDLFKLFVRDFSKGRVFVGCTAESDPEAANFTKELEQMLTDAGYQVVPKIGPANPADTATTGVHIRIRSMANQPLYAGSLQKGLEAIGIETAGELDDAAEDSVLILVGGKP